MFFERISVRITIWYALAFIVSSIALFLLNGYIFVSSLKAKDEDILRAKVREFSKVYQRDLLEGLRHLLGDEHNPDRQRFIVRIADESGKTLFLHIPEIIATHNQGRDLEVIKAELEKINSSLRAFVIPGEDYGDELEVVNEQLPSGHLLQIGKDVEDREEFLESYAQSFFIGLIPIVAFALLVGSLLSYRLLMPIRWLSNTVKSIHSGQSSARVPLRKTKDELQELGVLFNRMLDENAKLIQGMKNTLDNVAHDLRTPIMRLQTVVEDSLRTEGGAKDYREALAICRENSDGIVKLLDAIMDLSEAETGTLQLQREPIFLSQIVNSAVDLYGFVAEAKNISLNLKCEGDPRVIGDRVRLLQAVSNLIDNAIKYSPEGSAVKLSVYSIEEWALIDVVDEGLGITNQDLPKIWDRLYRGDPSRSTRGLGLGLTLVRAIAKAHSGTIHAAANEGPGMTFRLKLPQYFGQ